MEYSKIKNLYIKDFRNIGEATIDFSESPIVTLLGENEAGKTSVIKAFTVCALHSNPREQNEYIRDGSDSFGVAIELEDGTQIVRKKDSKDSKSSRNNNSYMIKYPDGHVYKIDKLAEGLPAEVASIMGLIEEPETKEYLHVRTYEDKLLFVVTPNSTNYKMMYNALKVENLTKAIKLGSNEVNQLKANIQTNENSIATLNNEVNSIKVVDTTQLISIREALKAQLSILDKIEKCKNLCNLVESYNEKLGALALIDRVGLQEISLLISSKLYNASKLLNNKANLIKVSQNMEELANISEIDTTNFDKVSKLAKKIEHHSELIKRAGSLNLLGEISDISVVLAVHLNKYVAINLKRNALKTQLDCINIDGCIDISATQINQLSNMEKVINNKKEIVNKEQTYKQCVDYIEQMLNYFKSIGVATETCPKCGETIVFDVEKL